MKTLFVIANTPVNRGHYLNHSTQQSVGFRLSAQLVLLFALFSHQVFSNELPAAVSSKGWASQSHSYDEWYRQAIIDGKEKRFTESLSILSALHLADPKNIRVLADYITVLTWAQLPQSALKFGEKLDVSSAPIYVLNNLARTARDTAQYALALHYYDALIMRQPSELDPKLGKILTLIDAKQFNDAESTISHLRELKPNNIAVLQAMSYLGQRANRPAIVADANMRILNINAQSINNPNPNNQNISNQTTSNQTISNLNTEAAKHLIAAASELGAEEQAFALAEQYPQSIDEKGLVAIQNNSAAFHVNWDKYTFLDISKRFEDADIALQTLDAACQCDWATLDLNIAQNRRLTYDRILALRDRFRMTEVKAYAEAILQSNRAGKTQIDLPAYILDAMGDAYLYLKNPQIALYYYECSLKKAPDNFETKISKFYALIEAERFTSATQFIDQTNTQEQPFRVSADGKVTRENSKKLRAELSSYMVRAYGDKLAFAEEKIATLAETGPQNTDLKAATAIIHRWRGWPEKSQAEFVRLLEDYPENNSFKVGLTDTMLDLSEWREAEHAIRPIVQHYPEDLNVQRLARRWMLRNERELQLDFNTGKSNGPTIGARSGAASGRIYSAPIDYDYRLFAQTRYDYGDFIEGNTSAFWPGVGAEYRARDWRVTAELNTTSLGHNGVSPEISVDYRVNDYWTLSSRAGINTADAPLRGLRVGTSADVLQLAAAYRLSDLTQASTSLGITNLSDGNQRKSFSLAMSQRITTLPHYKADLLLRLDTSSNDDVNTAYFNPERDSEISAVIDQRYVQWRAYDQSFSHRLQLGLGTYYQKNFGSDPSWVASYAHEWRWENRFELDYGVSLKRHAYDGTLETNKQLFGRLNWLF